MAHDRSQPPRRVDLPTPGLFKMRLVRGGPWVAAEIRCDDEGRWCALLDGVAQEPSHVDPALAEGVFRVWHYGVVIGASDHAYLIAHAAWSRAHAPDSPEANPTRPINLGALPPIF